ncbi:MAG: sigma-54 dependent transcriptional regulator [Chlorobi bacterium]|nr:sigma-54 dependent transcriptional regulator [Chlorobiota bacterium]MCI0715847.1 sigma-54 dependent transcriptional regulator [Chlorobiota bacterium]
MSKILIIEDDKAIVDILKMILEEDGFKIEHAFNGPTGLGKFSLTKPDVVLLDIRMPKMDGIEVLQEIRKRDKNSIVIMISGHGNIETAVQTTKLGAYDFISKPFDVERLKLTIQNGLNYRNLLAENESMKKIMGPGEKLYGESEEMLKLKETILKVAGTPIRVLITGENGAGKELVAKEIHRLSERADKPFVHVNCSTIPKDLIEVELFGCVEGYLSYSPQKRTGEFESADGGTIFLDEIADLSLDSQSKLLTVLSESRIEPIGGSEAIPVNVRVISSTNKNLQNLIAEGKFREDLFHRVNVLTINVPPLRNRKEDIPELIRIFSEEICKRSNLTVKKFTQKAVDYLCSLKWPGNVRELKNTVERLIILSDSETIDKKNIESDSEQYSSELEKVVNSEVTLRDFQDISEKLFIERKLAENNWNISKTAEALDIQRSHLYTKIKQFNIENPEKESKEQ